MDHLSSSQINLYLLCGLKYRFQYIDKLPKPFKSSALLFGSAIHSALSWLHDQRQAGTPDSLERLYKIFDADFYSQKVEKNITFKDGEDEMKLIAMGKEMLGFYYQEPPNEIKGSEMRFNFPLVNHRTGESLGINLEGYFDLIEADDTIVEFKTSAQTLSQSDIKSHLQLTAYGYAFDLLYGRLPRAFKLVNFVKTKKPKMEITETYRGKENFEAFFFLVEQVLNGIERKVFLPRPGYWCRDCEYAAQCPIGKADAQAV